MAFDLAAAVQVPFRMQPGLRRLADGEPHLTPARQGSRHQREKLAVLSHFAAQALCRDAAFDAGPALRAFCAQAASEHPDHWQWDGDAATALGVRVAADGSAVEAFGAVSFGLGDEVARCVSGLPPAWRLAGLLALAFEDDLALVDGTTGCIPWLAVALPSHWAPEHKVGQPFMAVHAPVADNRLLLAAGPQLMQLVTAGERWERFVWTITGHPRLHAHPDRVDVQRWPATDDPDALVAQAWWRTERQSFWPVPGLRQAVFTIRIGLAPLAQALTRADDLRRVREALATMSDAVLEYRGLTAVRQPLLAWLDAQRDRTAA